jgi:hypothetical protein
MLQASRRRWRLFYFRLGCGLLALVGQSVAQGPTLTTISDLASGAALCFTACGSTFYGVGVQYYFRHYARLLQRLCASCESIYSGALSWSVRRRFVAVDGGPGNGAGHESRQHYGAAARDRQRRTQRRPSRKIAARAYHS